MTRLYDAAADYQRRRFERENAHLYIRHDAWRYMAPGAPRWTGKDVVNYFRPEPQPEERKYEAGRRRGGGGDHERRGASDAELVRTRWQLAALRFELALVKHALALRRKANFDPNQPRVPSGHPDGGQWTNEGGDGNRQIIRDRTGQEPWEAVVNEFSDDGFLSRQTVTNRDGSAIRSEFAAPGAVTDWDERHSVLLADRSVFTFQNSGGTQTIFDSRGQQLSETVWTSDGPEPQATVQPVFLQGPIVQGGRVAIQKGIEAGLALYTWMSSHNTPDERAVIGFRADVFAPGENSESPAIWVGRLTREQVEEACPRYPEVQSITNQSADAINRGDYATAAQYGTAVHVRIKREINGPETYPASSPRDPNFRAEISLIKSREERYGKQDSIRVDVYENPGAGTVCTHDIKTARRGLSLARALELASNVQYFYPGTQRIIVTEVRPQR